MVKKTKEKLEACLKKLAENNDETWGVKDTQVFAKIGPIQDDSTRWKDWFLEEEKFLTSMKEIRELTTRYGLNLAFLAQYDLDGPKHTIYRIVKE